VKFLEAHDFHASPDWLELSEKLGKAVRDAAVRHKVAFIATSDFWDKPVYATNKGGFPRIKAIVDSWLEVCPVVVVQGTPSHDAPGCYDALPGVIVIQPGVPQVINGVQVHGIPELRKDQLQAQLGLPAEQANAEIMTAFRDFIRYVVAPQRVAFPGPAVGLLHGNVTDSLLSADVILRASDLVIHTEDLRPAGIDRWSLGHIHTPWESTNIFAGYCGFPGMDSNPWGKTGFVPAMNLVDLDTMSVDRIPYGTPMRRKITAPLAEYRDDVAYWLDTEDPLAVCPPGHPWNRLSIKEVKKELQRVTDLEAPRTLSQWFSLADPTVASTVLAKVDSLKTTRAAVVPVHVELVSVEVQGCNLFKGRRAFLDLATRPDGLNVLRGPNGAGKSSILAFCHPYPTVLGKDTESGRPSAIKDFFSSKDSVVKKTLLVNGEKHEHLITIKGAHTKSPKTECYLIIDGANVLDTASFDEMMTECERRYGHYEDYRITTFYEQPLQSRNSKSGIMVANMTDIRDVVQNIAGVDREPEKAQALLKVRELETETAQLDAKIMGASGSMEDPQALEAQAQELDLATVTQSQALAVLERDGKAAQDRLNILESQVQAAQAETNRKTRDEARAIELTGQITALQAKTQTVLATAEGLEANRELIRNDDALRVQARNATAGKNYRESLDRWNKAEAARALIPALQARQSGHEHAVEVARQKERLEAIQACPQCGYLAPDAEERFKAIKASIDFLSDGAILDPAAAGELSQAKANASMATTAPEAPHLETVSPCDGFPLTNRQAVEAAIKIGETAQATIDGIRATMSALQQELTRIQGETYHIVEVDGVTPARVEYAALRAEWSRVSGELHATAGKAQACRDRAKAVEEQARELQRSRDGLESLRADLEEWRYIAKMLQPTKIPALEMDLVVDSIDATATRILDDGRQYQTETAGGFDITVYDPESGTTKSLLRHSPGEKAFLSDAYVKALVQARNNREHRHYSPVIQDESDGPIQPERLRAYYAQQERFYGSEGVKVLVVTHNAEAHQMIDNVIQLEEVFHG